MSSAELALAKIPLELFESYLTAPCGDQNVHLVGVTVLQQASRAEITVDGATIRPTAPTGRRGAVVSVNCSDESGHTFELVLAFHKGTTTVARTECVACPHPPEELWRD